MEFVKRFTQTSFPFFKFYFFDKKSRIGDALLINFEQIVSFSTQI